MSLSTFAREYNALPPGEADSFAQAIQQLLTDGLLWRGDEKDYQLYAFLRRRQALVSSYLQVAGWELRHHERSLVFYVVHKEGAHRRRLSRDDTVWLLLLRLVYSEQRESMSVSLNRYPTITVGELYARYVEFFPGQAVRKKTSLDGALRLLQRCKLIRAAEGGSLRASQVDQLIELLPALEVVVQAEAIDQVAAQVAEYQRSRDQDEEEDEEQEA